MADVYCLTSHFEHSLASLPLEYDKHQSVNGSRRLTSMAASPPARSQLSRVARPACR